MNNCQNTQFLDVRRPYIEPNRANVRTSDVLILYYSPSSI